MSEHRYERADLWKDGARGGAGLAFVMVPATFAPTVGILQMIFSFLSLLFAGYLVRTALRARTFYRVSDNGLEAVGPIGAAIAWPDITQVSLKYYSTRKDRTDGWLQLIVKGAPTTGRGRISIDSTVSDFEGILAACAEAVRRKGLAISETTAENFKTLGHAVGAVNAPGEDQ